MTVYERAEQAAAAVRARLPQIPHTAVVLGTGLGGFADSLEPRIRVPYSDLPHWPESGVVGHAGELVAGRTADARLVIALSGRAHYYEGHSLEAATFSIRVLGRLGVRTLLLTNAAGGINTRFGQGALMIIDDHINFIGNPLVGPNDLRFGRRFPDMSEVYSRRLRGLADESAAAQGIAVEHGVYIGVTGPSYETPAEIRAFRTWGADAVGMSTVPEALVARHLGMEVLGLSCISNMAAGILPQALTEEEVIETTGRVRTSFVALLEGILARL